MLLLSKVHTLYIYRRIIDKLGVANVSEYLLPQTMICYREKTQHREHYALFCCTKIK